MIDTALQYLTTLMENQMLLAPVLVLLAGVLTSFLPCSLSAIPLIVGYVGLITDTKDGDKSKLLRTVLVFALGQVVTFTIIGVGTALLGKLLTQAGPVWFIFLGAVMVLMSLQVMDVVYLVKPINIKNNKRGLLGAFVTGLIGGAFASPCATPILIAIAGVTTSSGNVAYGVILMAMYGIGTNFLVVLSGMSTGLVTNIIQNDKYGRYANIVKYLMGVVLLIMGLYLFSLGF